MKILHLDSSILGDHSVSRAVSAAVVARLKALRPDAEIVRHDLAADPIAHLSGRYLAGQSPDVQHDQALQEDLGLGGKALTEFLAADTVVIGAPMYNFAISSLLKAWIDRVLVAGKTFHYTDKGAEGLAGGKRVIVAASRGGIYSGTSPFASFEHAESYLKCVFAFMGIPSIEVIVAEGIALGPEPREKALKAGLEAAAALH